MSRVNYYVHSKLCHNKMSGIQMANRNVICGVKFGWFLTFDQKGHNFQLWEKIKKSTVGLFSGTRSMTMPTFVEIWGVYYKIFKKNRTCSTFFLLILVHRASLWELKTKQLGSPTWKVPKLYKVMPKTDIWSKKWNSRTFCQSRGSFIDSFAPESCRGSLIAAD